MDLTIVTVEQPEYVQILRKKAQKVVFPLKKTDKHLIDSMKLKLKSLGGVGLAAPQVNYDKQIIAIYIPEEARLLREDVELTYPMHVMINPSYKAVDSTNKTADFEACYSVSSKAGKVPRYQTIQIQYYDEQGQPHQQIESGFYARVLQHEIDHIHGTLITDRLTPDCIQGSIAEMMAMRREELPKEKQALYDKLVQKKLNNDNKS